MPIVRDVVTVAGPDARRYLHGQTSQDVASLAPGGSHWTFLLAPTGRIDVLAVVGCVDDDTFELDTEAGYGDVLAARLERFRIRVKVEIAGATTTKTGDEVRAEAVRVAAGWPAMGSEIVPGEVIPAETAVTEWTVSFTKGCYPGQELVERMDSRRAAPPRRLRIMEVEAGAAPGDPIVDPASGETVGVLTSVAGGRGLGYVRRGSDVGAAPTGPPSSA